MRRELVQKLNFAIKDNIKKRKEMVEYNNFLRLVRKKEIEKSFFIGISLIIFQIKTLEELKKVREILRREFVIWEDELSLVECWYSNWKEDYEITFTWKGKYLPIHIQLECFQKNMSEELKNLKPGCSFIETIEKVGARELKNLNYVCST